MFAKIFRQSYDSSIARDYNVRRMFWEMLVLADRHGVVDMTYDAIARTTNVPIESVIACIGELTQPDPESRSSKNEGARLVPIDSHRSWGWQIVNYERYRNTRDEDDRRSYHRDYMRDRRAGKGKRRVKSGEDADVNNGASERETAPALADARECSPVKKEKLTGSDLPSTSSERPLRPVKSSEARLTDAEGEAEADKEPSAVSLLGRPAKKTGVIIHDRIKLKKIICERILDGKNPGRMWSPDAENKLAIMAEEGVPLNEVLDIGWFYSLPKNDEVSELKKRSTTLTETGLVQYWGDYAKRAGDYRKKIEGAGNAAAVAKPEPPQWRDFFKWQYTPDIKLPQSFWDLDPDQRKEYEHGFQTFVNAQREVATK